MNNSLPNAPCGDGEETKFLRHPIIKPAYEKTKDLCEARKKEITCLLNELAQAIPANDSLPPLGLAELDDGSVLIEWTFKDRRLGFTFEADPNDSGWYYVFSRGQSERYESGTMDQLEIERLVSKALKP